MSTVDDYYKGEIKFRYKRQELVFKVSQELFSSHSVDKGTQRLLRTIDQQELTYNKVLDLGCGYGPIGIALKVNNPECELHMVDRDALALEYARENSTRNDTSDAHIYASLGYDNVENKNYDLVVSNIPAKVGEKMIAHMLLGAQNYLSTDGRVVVVVVDEIAEYVESLLHNENIEILHHKSWHGHHVYHYSFFDKTTEDSTHFSSNAYRRGFMKFKVGNKALTVTTAYSLPEFDTLSYETALLIHNLSHLKKHSNVLMYNPGQGHVPVALSAQFVIEHITLVSRDLLSLRVSQENLKKNNYKNTRLYHHVDLEVDGSYDLIIGTIQDKLNTQVYKTMLEQLTERLAKNGEALLVGGSTTIKRLLDYIKSAGLLKILNIEKKRGKTLIRLKK